MIYNTPMVNFWHQLALQTKPFLTLAPMDGVTDRVFRKMIAGTAKPDVFFTEFTNTEALTSRGYEKTIHRLAYSDGEHPIVAQIWGTEPKNFSVVARLVRDLGFDGIDINMGCPDRAVMKMGSGASLIDNPPLAAAMIVAIKQGAPGMPVSVKTRIGATKVVTLDWIRFLLAQKIDALTVHGRTAKELSKVPAHWEEIGKAVRLRDEIAPGTVIIGNGDILTQIQAAQAHGTYGVDGVMMGKAVFQNPWVFERPVRQHSAGESLALLVRHAKLYADAYPGVHRFAPLKKYFKIYVRSFHGANVLLKRLMETENFSEVEELVKPELDRLHASDG